MKRYQWLALFFIFSVLGSPRSYAATQGGSPDLTVAVLEGETFRGKGADADFPRRIAVRVGDYSFELAALGSGLRKKAFFKVYEGLAYADEDASLDADPYAALLQGGIATRVEMYFLRDVGANKIRGAWEDGFEKNLGDDVDDALAADRDRFLAYFDEGEIRKGQTIAVTWLPGLGLFTEIAGDPKAPIDNPRVASAVLANWFGEKPISGDLKEDMLRLLRD